jgi:hypothetical protein
MSYRVTLLNATGELSPLAEYLHQKLDDLSSRLSSYFDLSTSTSPLARLIAMTYRRRVLVAIA